MAARAEALAASGERMLASAWRQFSRRPYEEVRLGDIAADAEVTVQTLHNRFGTKDDLFVAAFLWFGSQVRARRDSVTPGDIAAGVRAVFDSYEHHGRSMLRMQSEEERIPAVHKMIEAGRAYHRDWVGRTFAPLLAGLPSGTRERRLIELTVASDLLVWKLLRLDMGLDRAAAERIVTEMVTAAKRAG
jgi:AcrR family transcriptional regulator